MMEQELFPIPNSGQIKIVPRRPDAFDVECAGLDVVDKDQLEGFSTNGRTFQSISIRVRRHALSGMSL